MAGQNRSLEIITLANVRVAGTRDDRFPGVPFGGTYYPAGKDRNGNDIPARFECSVYINRGSYVNNQGQRVERQPDIIRIVLWNGRNLREAGKGLADIAAKCLAPGKELSLLGNLHSYQGRVFIDGNTINKSDGSVATMLKHSITVIPGTMNLGADAEKQLEFEYQYYERNPQQFSFWSRPRDWQTQQSPGHGVWKQFSATRMATSYQGGDVFGYAIVRQTNQAVAPPMADTTGLAAAYSGGATNLPAGAPAMGAPAINPGTVNTATGMPTLPAGAPAMGTPVAPAPAYGGAPVNTGIPTGQAPMPGAPVTGGAPVAPAQAFNAGTPAQPF